MSNTLGNAKDLDSSRKQVLQGLLSSLGHARDSPSSDTKLSAEQLRKLSEKIHEILGDDTDRDATREDQPSQLLNEDGLPIIDISEPVNGDPQMSTPHPYNSEQELVPLSNLPPDERERRRRDRDRILDLLEEEERLQQLQEERDAEEERKEAIRKRKESARAELAQLKAAQELQKKMGQALIGRAKGALQDRRDENVHSKPRVTTPVSKKIVSFVDAPAVEADERDQQMSIPQPDWGDITPGRLRAQTRLPLVSTEAQKHPMKMHVVERRPTTASTSPTRSYADSDDESPLPGNLSSLTGNDSSNGEEQPSPSDSDFGDDEPLEGRFDHDAVQHHREIALEYHRRRHGIGAETAKALAVHDPDDGEQHETFQYNERLPLSRFRADRMAAAYDGSHNPDSVSIGPNVIPASRQKYIQDSVRLGKLENDQLVGGDPGESGSEDETVREVIQMLRTGRIENAGPDFLPSSISTIPPHKSASDAVESATVGTSTFAYGLKPTFELALGGRATEKTTFQNDNSKDNYRSQPVVSGVVEQKAPRPSPSQRFPVNKPPPRPPVEASEPVPPMIIDSPSFPMTTSVVVPSSSRARTTTSVSPSPSQTQLGHPSLVKSSTTRDSMIRSPVPYCGPSDIGRPVSKFMAERKK